MAAESAKIVDFQAYRHARLTAAADQATAQAAPSFVAPPVAGMQPMMMWVPVWAFVPVMANPMAGQWVHAQ